MQIDIKYVALSCY